MSGGRSADLVFLHPGTLDTPTGGYVYDRALVDALRHAGISVETVSLGSGYPAPAPDALNRARSAFESLADGQAVLVDGLAYGVLDEIAAPHAERLCIVALVHHPLALESGLARDNAARLHAQETAALALARRVIVTSPATARIVSGDFGVAQETILVVEPGTGPGAGPVALPPKAERAASSVPRLVAVGSLVPRKDYPTLLAALAGLEGPFRLDVAGSDGFDPCHAAMLRARVTDSGLAGRVFLHGALPRPQIDRLYAQADLFVLTTLYEGYGIAFVEAMAAGLPIVATGEGAVRDTVPAEAGIVLGNGDIDGVAEAIRGLLADPERRIAMGHAARRHAAGLPGWDEQAHKVAALLEGLTRETSA
jgi:glycosyltransferase involved in cell wall biosynthesis